MLALDNLPPSLSTNQLNIATDQGGGWWTSPVGGQLGEVEAEKQNSGSYLWTADDDIGVQAAVGQRCTTQRVPCQDSHS